MNAMALFEMYCTLTGTLKQYPQQYLKIGAFAVISHYFCSKQSFELICSIQNFPLAFHFQEKYTNAEDQNGKENLQMLDESTNLLLKMLNLELEALHTSYEYNKPEMPVFVFTSPTQQNQHASQMANQYFNRFNVNALQQQDQHHTMTPYFKSPDSAAATPAQHNTGADMSLDVNYNQCNNKHSKAANTHVLEGTDLIAGR